MKAFEEMCNETAKSISDAKKGKEKYALVNCLNLLIVSLQLKG